MRRAPRDAEKRETMRRISENIEETLKKSEES